MTDFRQRLIEQTTRIRRHVGVAIVYSIGDVDISIEKAVKFPPIKRSAMATVAIDLTAQDWGIGVDDLVHGGEAIEPKRGHRITHVDTGFVYDVLPNDGDAVCHPSGADSQHRVHSKRIE